MGCLPNPSSSAMLFGLVQRINLPLMRSGAPLPLEEIDTPEPGPLTAGETMIAEYAPHCPFPAIRVFVDHAIVRLAELVEPKNDGFLAASF